MPCGSTGVPSGTALNHGIEIRAGKSGAGRSSVKLSSSPRTRMPEMWRPRPLR